MWNQISLKQEKPALHWYVKLKKNYFLEKAGALKNIFTVFADNIQTPWKTHTKDLRLEPCKNYLCLCSHICSIFVVILLSEMKCIVIKCSPHKNNILHYYGIRKLQQHQQSLEIINIMCNTSSSMYNIHSLACTFERLLGNKS